MWLLYNVAAIHELPLHIVTETFSTIDVFKKLNRYDYFNVRIECWTISMTLEGKMPSWSVPTTEMTMAATIKGEMVSG